MSVAEVVLEGHRNMTRSRRIAELAETVQGEPKFLPPCVVRDGQGRLVLLGGELRFRAVQKAGEQHLKVYVVRDWPSLAGWLVLDSREAGRTEMTRSEVGRFTLKATKHLGLSAHDVGYLDQFVGDTYDYATSTVRESRWVISRTEALPPGKDRAEALADLKAMDAGTVRPSSLLGRLNRRAAERERAAGAQPPDKQRAAFNRALPNLQGTLEALTQLGPVSAELTEEERADWESRLRTASTHLVRIVRNLKQLRESST